MDEFLIELKALIFVLLFAFLAPICVIGGVNAAVNMFFSSTAAQSCEVRK